MKFEEFMKHYVGDFGTFQLLALLIAGLSAFIGNDSIANNFIAGEQEHWCFIPELEHIPHDQQKEIAIPYDEESDGEEKTYSSCTAFKLNYSEYTTNDFYYWNRSMYDSATTYECTSWVYDQSLYVNTITSKYDLVCDNAWKISFMSTLMMLGFLLGSIISGIMSDKYGRLFTTYCFFILRMFASIFNLYAPNYAVFVTARFLVGMGSFADWLVLYVYASEICGARYRAIIGILVYLFHSTGYSFVPIYAFFLRDYIGLIAVHFIPVLFFAFAFAILPESPRWLLVNSKWERAEKSLRKIATINKKVIPSDFDVHSLEIQVQTTTKSSSSPWGKFVKHPPLVIRLAVISFIWFTCSLMYWALSFNTGSLSGNIYLNTFLLGIVELPALLLSYYCMGWPRLGRRLTCGFALLVAAASSFLTIPFIVVEAGGWSTAMSLIGKCFVTLCFSAIYLYSCELLPTEVRSGGVGFASLCARISGMAAPFIGGPLAEVSASLPSIIFGTTALLAGILCIWLLPETLGKKMPETVDDVINSNDSIQPDGSSIEEKQADLIHKYETISDITLNDDIFIKSPVKQPYINGGRFEDLETIVEVDTHLEKDAPNGNAKYNPNGINGFTNAGIVEEERL